MATIRMGASLVTSVPSALVVKPLNLMLEGVWDVPSNATVRVCRVQVISFEPSMLMFVPAV